MVESFLRMTQILQKLIISKMFFLTIFVQVFWTIFENFACKKRFRNSTRTSLGIFSRQFGRYNCNFLLGLASKHPKNHETTKSTLFDKLIPIFVQTTNVFEEKNFNDLSVETIRYSKLNWGKKWDEVHPVFDFPNFRYFRHNSPNFRLFLKNYFNQKHHRLRMETCSYR